MSATYCSTYVAEVESADSDERIQEDNARATAVLEEIGMSTELEDWENAMQPMKTRGLFGCEKMMLMRNPPKLENSNDPHLKLIRIRKDMTPMEGEEDLNLKREWEGKKE